MSAKETKKGFVHTAVLEDRKIITFPAMNKDCFTPFEISDFSHKTYKKCWKDGEFISGNWLNVCKVIILGDVSVGKTSIVNRYCRKMFDTNYKSTIGVDFEMETFEILGVSFTLQIWDTAGQERFKSIAQSYYRGAHVILLVFDLTSLDTLYSCQKWLSEALMSVTDPIIFMVGSKLDLVNRFSYDHITKSAFKLARKLNAEYWPVSSRTGRNLNAMFNRVAALSFDEYIVKSDDEPVLGVPIGKSLIDLRQDDVHQRAKKNCFSSKCK
ncbi:unnamed protein product [Acanthoscelides obtectus]|uniref:Ras-related protein Rab-36 n=2 Tax=Acanthoscelides obtectus TaxID=200917 RepID=A0A9P0JV91_ACAOB|nr:unnamed protein product [Acanthoscelides obtectus]CAK1653013.1 Ras-related protein Rab-34 [Acanthoscelides obtectus]